MLDAYRYLASVYDDMMYDVDYASWAGYLHTILQGVGAKRIRDVACGTGSITRALYRIGYDITASDASASMLKIAKETARIEGKDIRFVRQDMRSTLTGNPVDAVVCACDGVNYLNNDGLEQFAASAYQSLRTGGLLLFDISTPHKLKHVLSGQTFFDDGEDATCIWHNTFDERTNALTMDVTLFMRTGDVYERFDETHVQTAHDPAVVTQVLKDAGYSRVDQYECYTMHAPIKESHRIQFVCQKA